MYEPYDELVLMQLSQYDKKTLTSIESMIADDMANTDSVGSERQNCLKQDEASELVEWAEKVLGSKVKKVKVRNNENDRFGKLNHSDFSGCSYFIISLGKNLLELTGYKYTHFLEYIEQDECFILKSLHIKNALK